MNLRAVANRLTRSVNSNEMVQVYSYSGQRTNAAGRQSAEYLDAQTVAMQCQALTKKDIEHLASLNLSTVEQVAFVNRPLSGVDRLSQTGGDLIDKSDGRWLVTAVLEGWSSGGWRKVALTRQIDTSPLAIVPGRPVWSVQDWQGDTNG